MAETSFSWNFDAGTLAEDIIKSLQESVQRRSAGYGLPLTACLPGSDELVVTSKRPTRGVPAQLDSESDKLLYHSSDKVKRITSQMYI